jgi:HK97 family phage major capsid protein/HK97 family phage prohead protease
MQRAFTTLELRAVDEEHREFEGIANSAALDDHGTIIDPAGARFSLPLAPLWMHDQSTPVGEITEARMVDGRWRVRGSIRRIEEDGYFKTATDRAWQGVKHRLVRGLSIGFKPLKQKGNRFTEWAWRELSLVTIPSNQEATIEMVRASFAESGVQTSPGVSGTPSIRNTNPRRPMTILEQIRAHEESRAAKMAANEALMTRASDEGRTLDESEAEDYDTTQDEIEAIDNHLRRLNGLKRSNDAKATAVVGHSTKAAAQSRGGEPAVETRGVPVVRVRSNEEPGIGFARYAMAIAACNGNRYEAAEYATRTFGEQAEGVALMLRAPVAAGTTTNATFAAPLVQTNYMDEFLEMLRPATLVGRIPGLRRVPFNVSMPAQTAGGSYSWVGEGVAKRVTNAQFGTVTLGMSKAAGIIVLTEELVKSSSPSAQEVVRDELVQGIGAYLDGQFADPAVAAVAGVSPASITNGVTGTAASGTTEAAARADLRALLGGFVSGNFGLGGVVLLMSEGTAFTLGTVVNAVGDAAFPGITATGGSLLGIPVVTSNAVGNRIIALHAPSILLADDGPVNVDISREASIQMDDAPDNPTTATTILVSLWQRNLVGLRAERWINWARARAGSVRMTTGVAYA